MTTKVSNNMVEGKLETALNLSDVANAASAFSNIKQAATTEATGVVEQATQGEMNAGTAGKFPDCASIINALGAANTASLAGSGWWKDGKTGLIVQWGTGPALGAAGNRPNWDFYTNLPTAFPNAALVVVGSWTSTDATGNLGPDPVLGVRFLNNSQIAVQYERLSGTTQVMYIAIGY